jgi:adenosylhomocysteine nucleosidase
MLVIMFAMAAEQRELKKALVISKTSVYRDCRIYEGKIANKNVLLAVTGVGQKRAVAATEFILNRYPVDAMISSGFAGSLNNKTAVGDIVIYSSLTCEMRQDSAPVKTPAPVSFPSLQLSAFSLSPASNSSSLSAGCHLPFTFRVCSGKGISISRVCVTPRDKLKLGLESGADVVDMESYWIGQIADQRNIPFITVRSISDSIEDDLSILVDVMDGEKINPIKVMGYLIAHPGQLRMMASRVANSRKAGKNLAVFLGKLARENEIK